MSATNGYNFTASTRAVASQINQNFEWFRGHYLPITQSGTWANTTGVFDIGSTTQRWRNVFANGYSQPGAGGETLRMIRGNVQGSATITAGTGFTVARTGAGVYEISLSAALIATMTCVVTVNAGTPKTVNAGPSPALNVAAVQIQNDVGANEDNGFGFVIIAPA